MIFRCRLTLITAVPLWILWFCCVFNRSSWHQVTAFSEHSVSQHQLQRPSSNPCRQTTALEASSNTNDSERETPVSHGPILVVGATGGTGLRALQGLLDVGCQASQMRLLTRDPSKPSVVALQAKLGCQLVQADLENGPSQDLDRAVRDCVGCYVHAVAGDTREVTHDAAARARTLAQAIGEHAAPNCHVVFNSAAGEVQHGVDRIQQMHNVEGVFLQGDYSSTIRFTGLRANLFMEELWKKYTRPAILKGSFPFSIPSERRMYLTSIRDTGRIAGTCLLESSEIGNLVNVAGDVLTPKQIAQRFANSQGSPCQHSPGRLFYWLSRLLNKDLYQIITFYRRSTETTDIDGLQTKFPKYKLMDFRSFLEETRWENRDLTYEQFLDLDGMFPSEAATVSD